MPVTVFFKNGQVLELRNAGRVEYENLIPRLAPGGSPVAIVCYGGSADNASEEGRFKVEDIVGYAVGQNSLIQARPVG